MHCVLTDPSATDGPIAVKPSRPIAGLNSGPPAVVELKIRKLHFAPFPTAAIDGHRPERLGIFPPWGHPAERYR